MKIKTLARVGSLAVLSLLTACNSSEPFFGLLGGAKETATAGTSRYLICPGPNAQKEALIAFFDAREGDTIEFCEGQFEFDTGLIMTGKRGITLKGAGINKTYLRFENSSSQDGISINQVDGIVVSDLTIYDAPGNGLRIFRTNHVTIQRVKVGWSNSDPATPYGNYDATQESWSSNGAYAFYPVITRYVLIEDSISVGSADAGVYIGQSSDILVRRTEAYHNVAGFEFENTYRAEFVDNIAHDNVGGFLVFDLPGRVQFGEKNRVHRNKSYSNNVSNFGPRGAIIGSLPAGTGMLVLASDQLEVHDNEIYDNRTTGLALVNYGLADANEASTNYDFFSEGLHIYNNTFRDNGYDPQLPEIDRASCAGDPRLPTGLPGPPDLPIPPEIPTEENPTGNLTKPVDCLTDNPTLLPAILLVKNKGKSAHILWDGGVDRAPNKDKDGNICPIPVDRDDIALNLPNPNDTLRPEPRLDERGRPNLYQFDPIPACKYNAWKFDGAGVLKKPENGLCVEGNTFENTLMHPTGLLVDDFANAHFSTADPTDSNNQTLSDNTPPTDCPTVPLALMPLFTPVLPHFVPNPDADPRPTEAEIAAACDAVKPGEINYEAVLNYNCPRLSGYGLYVDEQDPRKGTIGRSMPFELNSILFSDYASKYRFMVLPPGSKAEYQDHAKCETLNIYDCYSQTLKFPVGTVFSKTFTFKDGSEEDVVETRLLIKRQNKAGGVYWTGFAYLWQTGADGKRYAELKIEGAEKSVAWDYDDEDPEARDTAGNRPHYTGSSANYAIPNAGACVLCHNGDDLEAGAPPIGPKPRNLNRDSDIPGIGVINQLAYMQSQGFVDLPPGPAEQLEHLPRWNVPGDARKPDGGNYAADSPEDIHKRVRAYLEVNCYHCHNGAGNAQNSGLNLNSFTEPMRTGNGICKVPIAAGQAADFGNWDIQPGDSGQSILNARLASTEAGIKMPPLARSVMHAEAVELINRWVDSVLPITDSEGKFVYVDDNDNFCGSGGGAGTLPTGLMRPLPEVPPTPAQKAPWG
ncbi:MAG: parallel beta-helix domain-containing protein [Pseudomonadota bacterium]